MRDHKFRIWHNRYGEGEMIYLTPFKQRYDYENGFVYAFSEGYSEFYCHENYGSREDFKVMQFVGIKDFYEGDIVNHCGQPCVIVWSARDARFMLEIIYHEPPEGIRETHRNFPLDGNGLDKIGNIFENPELLK